TLSLPRQRRDVETPTGAHLRRSFAELVEGLRFIRDSALVRAVILGLGTGLVGGGMLVPLGPIMSKQVLGGGSAGFGLLLTAMGTGVAAGIIGLSVLQRKVPHERMFVLSVLGAGVFQVVAATMSTLAPALILVAGLGLCAGSVYVLGFSILQGNVGDELRGRIFATLYTLVRFCLVLSFTVAPILSKLLDKLSTALFEGSVAVGAVSISLPGVRLTLWLGGVIIVVAGLLARRTLGAKTRSTP
ncbi:MAG TPA: hypothetical protein VHE80_00870, partial [Acidimicrobiales bacterium]|nr:hypothetical protein [Acidimicrobiales bacterium]